MNFGKIAMKLRYGQVAMKILRYGPIGETRADTSLRGPLNIKVLLELIQAFFHIHTYL